MKIAHSDFLRLIDAVTDAGGKHLDEACTGEVLEYKDPKTKKVEKTTTNGCNQDTLFEVPYDPAATVAVPEPILEPDPDRSEWTDENGDGRVTRRARKNEHGEPIWEIVMRRGRENDGYLSSVKVCALDDNVGMWPRFKGTMLDERSK